MLLEIWMGVTLGEEVGRSGHVGHVLFFDLGVVPQMHSFLCALFCMYVVQYCRKISSQWHPVIYKVNPKALWMKIKSLWSTSNLPFQAFFFPLPAKICSTELAPISQGYSTIFHLFDFINVVFLPGILHFSSPPGVSLLTGCPGSAEMVYLSRNYHKLLSPLWYFTSFCSVPLLCFLLCCV